MKKLDLRRTLTGSDVGIVAIRKGLNLPREPVSHVVHPDVGYDDVTLCGIRFSTWGERLPGFRAAWRVRTFSPRRDCRRCAGKLREVFGFTGPRR